MLSLALLTSLVSGIIKVPRSQVSILTELLPILEPLRAHPVEAIAKQATAVMTAIATRNPKWAASEGDDSEDAQQAESVAVLEMILKDLEDPLLPIRTYGARLFVVPVGVLFG